MSAYPMTPPDAMSWDEAVALLEDAAWQFDEHSGATKAKSALAAIQSHRVQAEARVKALEVKARCWDDLMAARNKPKDEADQQWMELAAKGELMAAIKACRAVNGWSLTESKDVVMAYVSADRTALAAAANNDGGSNERMA